MSDGGVENPDGGEGEPIIVVRRWEGQKIASQITLIKWSRKWLIKIFVWTIFAPLLSK